MILSNTEMGTKLIIFNINTGFPFAFGVFQNYYQTHEPFKGSPGISVIGTCALVRHSLQAITLQYPIEIFINYSAGYHVS